jgi:hypothetical protein
MAGQPITLDLAAPARDADHPSRPQLLRSVESLRPGATLTWTAEPGAGARTARGSASPDADAQRLIRVPDRDAFVRDRLERKEVAHLFSGPAEPYVSVHFEPSSVASRDGSRSARTTVWVGDDVLRGDLLWKLLAASAESLEAWYGSFMPLESAALLVEILFARKLRAESPAAALLEAVPALQGLRSRSVGPLPTAAVPAQIGWLNYWSADTARFVGFVEGEPVPFARWERTPVGAWMLQVTDDPFDVRRPDHAAALVAAYRRFPQVGGRH